MGAIGRLFSLMLVYGNKKELFYMMDKTYFMTPLFFVHNPAVTSNNSEKASTRRQ